MEGDTGEVHGTKLPSLQMYHCHLMHSPEVIRHYLNHKSKTSAGETTYLYLEDLRLELSLEVEEALYSQLLLAVHTKEVGEE